MYKTPLYSYEVAYACEVPYVALKALDILALGGNAADVAVFMSLALSVSIPHLGGLGGDLYAIIYDRDTEDVEVVMGSGYSGKYASIETYIEHGYSEMPRYGAPSVTIPGLIDGLRVLWEEYGSREWSELVRPVIDMCRDGFPLSRALKVGVKRYISHEYVTEEFRNIFGFINGLEVGARIRFNRQAKLLEYVCEDPRNFYEGDPAKSFLSVLNAEFPLFSEDDFKNYYAYVTDPLVINYRGLQVYEMPLNSLGISTLQLLRLHEYMGLNPPSLSVDRIKYYYSLYKPVYYIREKYLADPRFMDVDIDELLDPVFISRFSGVDAGRRDGDTTFFCIIDDRYVIGCIQSIFHPFGSLVVDEEYGVVFNNRGSSFTFDTDSANFLAPNKYPLHTLSTPILKGDDEVYVLGLSAGIFRPQLHLQLITNLIDYGMYPQDAIEYPRFIWDPEGGWIRCEEQYHVEGDFGVRIERVKYGSRLGVGAIARVRDNILSVYPDIRGEMYPCGR